MAKDKTKREFVVFGIGDESVGIGHIDARVTFEDNLISYGEYMIEEIKDALASLYDVPKRCVYTKAEWIDAQLAELRQVGIEWALREILDNRKAPSLNYCVNYAKAALTMLNVGDSDEEVSYQLTYVLSNMSHFRGKSAKGIRDTIKYYQMLVKEREELEKEG